MGLATVRARRRRVRGMAMVEMVFVLPVLLLLVFSIAELSMMFSRWLTLISAVQEGARYASLYRVPCDPTTVAGDAKKVVQSYVSAGGIDPSAVTINVTACGGTGTPSAVTANFPFAFQVLPGLTQLFAGAGFPATIPLSSTSTMRNE